MNLLPLKYLRKSKGSKSNSASMGSLLACMNLIRINRSHVVFMYLSRKPRLGMPLNMRSDDLDICVVWWDLPGVEH